jgi:cytochrome b involved in lipid metabolism
MGKGSKNWDPPSVVDDQQQDSSNSIINENENVKRQFTWEEIRRHSNKKDRWIVINNHVYDITKWVKHPGGQMVLNHYAGQDATVKIINQLYNFSFLFI